MDINKELKFRQAITDETGKFRWHYWGYLHVDIKGLPVFISPLAPVEWDYRPSYRFTGIKDKNGKEIFEGDILRSLKKAESIIKWEVVFHNGSWTLKMIRDSEIPVFGAWGDFAPFEMIGNVHENPNNQSSIVSLSRAQSRDSKSDEVRPRQAPQSGGPADSDNNKEGSLTST